jgi:hypothetical protein
LWAASVLAAHTSIATGFSQSVTLTAATAIVDRERVATQLAGSLVRLLPDAAAGALHRVDFPIDEAQREETS